MDIEIKVLDGFKLEAKIGTYTISSDQSKDSGGDSTAPNPFEYFLASTGLCVAHYANAFCKQRDIASTDIKITEKVSKTTDGKLLFNFEVKLPSGFPEKYKEAILKAMEGCTVKKSIQGQPIFEVKIV